MKHKEKAGRNRTLSLSAAEISKYKKRLFRHPHPLPCPPPLEGEGWVGVGGDLMTLENKIIPADLFDVLDKLPDKFIDLLFIDPPYNLTKNFGGKTFKKTAAKNYEEWVDSWLSKMPRLLKPDASIYICADWQSSNSIYNIAAKYFTIQNRITWQREKGRGAANNWKNVAEDIWFCSSGGYKFYADRVQHKKKVIAPYRDAAGLPKDWHDGKEKFRLTAPSNLWNDISIPFWSMKENTNHPTQKPEKLLAKIILASSDPGDMVFDPFLGSGTTAVVAKKLGRRFSGIEQDLNYCCLAEKRLEMAENDKTIQGYKDGVFLERNAK